MDMILSNKKNIANNFALLSAKETRASHLLTHGATPGSNNRSRNTEEGANGLSGAFTVLPPKTRLPSCTYF